MSADAASAVWAEGWARPPDARKAHYFGAVNPCLGRRSLCGRWLWHGPVEPDTATADTSSPGDCATCRQRFNRYGPESAAKHYG